VDVSGSEGRDPIKDFEAVNEELSQYSETLSARPQLVAANKSDIAGDRVLLDRFRTYVEDKGYRFFEISAATHAGVGALTRAAAEELKKLPPIRVYEPEYIEPEIVLETAEELSIEMQDNVYYIEGPWMERLLDRVNLSETESLHYFDRVLRASGLFDRLEEMGIREGDTVVIYNWEFEYKK
jgi:GTP-binding protein